MSFSEHWGYVSDTRRLALYARAIAAVLRPGDHVLDLGCGTGILGLLCLRAGATRLTAVERSSFAEIARTCLDAAAAGAAVETIRADSRHVFLDRPADLAICDHVGYLGIDYGILPMVRDARRRLLAPEARAIPAAIDLHLACVEAPGAHHVVTRWRDDGIPAELAWLGQHEANALHAVTFDAGDLLSSPARLDGIDLLGDERESYTWAVSFQAGRSGTLHGLAGWFDALLAPGIRMTNAPGDPGRITRPQAYLPIETPLAVTAGDRIDATLAMRASGEPVAWTVFHPASGTRVRHSTLAAAPLAAGEIARLMPDHRPRLTAEGRACLAVLQLCDGGHGFEEIVEALRHGFPELDTGEDVLRDIVAAMVDRHTA